MLLAFVGNYMGKLAYCQNKQSVAGGVKAFDSLKTHEYSLQNALLLYRNESASFPSQIEGGWPNHANQLTALVKAYCVNPKGFTGARLANSSPEEIRKELYGYVMTALKYYQETKNVRKQLEIAELLYTHKYQLSIPIKANTNIDVALETFNAKDCQRRELWDSDIAHQILASNPTSKQAPHFTHEEWKKDFSQYFKTKIENLPSPEAKERLLKRLNAYTAMMESLSIIEHLKEGGKYTVDQEMEKLWAKHMHDLQPLDSSGDVIELTLALKAFEVVVKKYEEWEKAWQVESALHQLHEIIKNPDKIEVKMVQLTQFVRADLGLPEEGGIEGDGNKASTTLPVALYTWLTNQVGELNRHNPEQQGLIQELFECVKVREDDTNKPEETTKKLKAYYSKYFKKDKTFMIQLSIKMIFD
jgi:hypothetical protein